MALSREQFQKLRDRGLSVDQIVKFEKGDIPANKAPSPIVQAEKQGTFRGLGNLYSGEKDGIASRLYENIKEGAIDIQKGMETGGIKGVPSVLKGIAKSGLRTAGDTAGAIFAPVGAVLEKTGANKVLEDIQGNVEQGKGLVGGVVDKLTDIPAVQEFALKHPNASEDFNRVMTLLLSKAEKGKIEPKTVVPRTLEQGKKALDSAKTVKDNILLKNAQKSAQEVYDASQHIVGTKQSGGKMQDIPKGIKVFSRLDTDGVKTFKDLEKVVNSGISKNTAEVDAIYNSVGGTSKLPDLNKVTKVKLGNRTTDVKVNYVEDALNHLEEAYSKSGLKADEARIKLLREQAQIDGLTPSEINLLAREYGTEFGNKAFNAKGDALTSVNAKAYENTRSGIKETAREFLPDNASKTLDLETSEMIRVKKLTNKMSEAVSSLEAKITKRNILEKMGRGVATGIDMATGGALRAFTARLLPSNVGIKTMNALELQQTLGKNLKIIKEALKSKTDAELIKYIKELDKSASK